MRAGRCLRSPTSSTGAQANRSRWAMPKHALREATDPLLRARCEAAIAMWAGTSDLARASEAARAALELLEGREDADPSLVALALGARVRADLFLGDGLDRASAERALELETFAPPRSRRHARCLQARAVAAVCRRLRRRASTARTRREGRGGRGRRIVALQHPPQPDAARVLVRQLGARLGAR